jgi:hypothetical protein
MHASIEELLSLRDGEDDAAFAHVAGCAQCRAELERLRRARTALAELPLQQPAPSAWSGIQRHAARQPKHSRVWMFTSGMGVAAALMLVGLLVLRAERSTPPVQPAPLASTTSPANDAGAQSATSATDAQSPATADSRDALIERSRQLEAALAAVRFDPQLVNAGTAATIETLQDHIAFVDYRLSMEAEDPLPPEQERRLWQQRVDLMDSLVNVRYAQLQRVSY